MTSSKQPIFILMKVASSVLMLGLHGHTDSGSERDLDSGKDLGDGQRPRATATITLQGVVLRLQRRNLFQSGFQSSRGSGSQYSTVVLRWK